LFILPQLKSGFSDGCNSSCWFSMGRWGKR
jgi:hypothetical protein